MSICIFFIMTELKRLSIHSDAVSVMVKTSIFATFLHAIFLKISGFSRQKTGFSWQKTRSSPDLRR
jgi:hypothetical protein